MPSRPRTNHPASAYVSEGAPGFAQSPHQVALATPERIVVVEWPQVARDGHRPGSPYVHAVWLGVLGPSATLAWERLSRQVAAAPGAEVDCADLARSLGLGDGLGHNAPLSRSLARMVAFKAAARPSEGVLAVRLALPDASPRQLARLSRSANLAHQRWGHGTWQPAAMAEPCGRELAAREAAR